MEKLKVKINKQRFIGVGYVISASFCYGTMPAITQLAFISGLSIETLLAIRFPLGLLITWGYIFKKKLNYKLNKSEHLFVMSLGILYIGFAICTNQSVYTGLSLYQHCSRVGNSNRKRKVKSNENHMRDHVDGRTDPCDWKSIRSGRA